MTEKEIERLAELIAIRVNEKYLVITKDLIDDKIQTHEFKCEAGKFSKAMGIVFAVIGGSIVAGVSWVLRKV
jgi:hypothetical protein